MMKRLMAGTAGVIAMVMAAGAATSGESMTWDVDGDGYVTHSEFYQGFSNDVGYEDMGPNESMDRATFDRQRHTILGIDDDRSAYWTDDAFDRWDANKDGFVSRREYSDGVHRHYDVNQDDRLDREEFDRSRVNLHK
ncbi:MAG: hypothetical protein RIM84_08830 [Alphaproteobacteria bacterium]